MNRERDERMGRGNPSAVALISLLIALTLPAAIEAKVVERIVAIINDDVITKSELDFALFNRQRELMQTFKLSPEELKAKLAQEQYELIDQMIRNHLLIQEAHRKKIEVSEDEIKETINRIKKLQNIKLDPEFQTALAKEGYTLNSFHEDTKKRLIMEKLMTQEVISKIEITDSDIEKFYQENRDQFPDKGAKVNLRHIFIKFDADSGQKKNAQAKAESILKQLKSGENFASLAQKLSDDLDTKDEGGDLGEIEVDSLTPEIRKAILHLKTGEISQPVQSTNGIHIFKVEKIETIPFDDNEKEQLRNFLFTKRFQEEIDRYTLELKTKAFVKIMLDHNPEREKAGK